MKNKKIIALISCMALIVGSVGMTLAWLTAESGEITNTFTSAKMFSSDDSFTLLESTATDDDGDGVYTLDENNKTAEGNEYKILPGVNLPKDPEVNVDELEEHAYLFIEVTADMPNGLTYAVDNANWTQLEDNIWVYTGSNANDKNVIPATPDAKVSFTAGILSNDEIVVSPEYVPADGTFELSFKAYMVQAAGLDSPGEAWNATFGK